MTPYQLFLRQTAALSVDDESYLVDLTRALKEYIENMYHIRIKGKTSSEIIDELRDTPFSDNMLHDIESWLRSCDRMKFSGLDVNTAEKQSHYENLLSLTDRVDSMEETT